MGVGSRSGRGDLCTAQESREEVARSGGAMRTRVCARVATPHGVGALLLVGGAIVGAAVVVWRRRGDGKGAKNDRRGKEDDEVLDGGAVENEQRESDQSDENLRREDTEAGADALFQDGKGTEELQGIQEQVDEIVADELDSRLADKFDPNSIKEPAENIDDTDSGDVRKPDQNSAMSFPEDEITPNATEGVKNSDQSAFTISSPGIVHEEEHSGHGDGADIETTSTQITPSTQMAAHQSQMSEQLKVGNKTETSTVQSVLKHEEQKPPAQELVAPIDSPPCSSLPALHKPAKKRPATTGRNETGMKLGQDGGSKKGAAKGVAVVTMDRRAASVAILAIIFVVTIGVNVVARLYSSLRAT